MKKGDKIRVVRIGKTKYRDQFGMVHSASIEVEERYLTFTHTTPYTYYGQPAGDSWYATDDKGQDYVLHPQTDFGAPSRAWFCKTDKHSCWYSNYRPWMEPVIPLDMEYDSAITFKGE